MTNNINRPPGILDYTGQYKKEPIHIDTYAYNEKAWIHKVYDSINDIKLHPDNTWINITGLHDMTLLKDIEKRFGINRFILEDIVQVSRHSKIESFDTYTFSIFKMLYQKDDVVKHEHVSILKLDKVLITFQETKGDVFGSIRHGIENFEGSLRTKNIDYLYYRLIDALVDQYFEILPLVNEKLEALEYQLLEENSKVLEDMYKVRKELVLIKNSVFPLKALVQNYVTSHKNEIDNTLYYDDILDHLDQIYDHVALYRELVNSLYDMHMSNLSHKMNRVMTTLAIFSAIFIPLSFLAGFFGMNFTHFPGMTSDYSIYIFTFCCLLLGGGMFGFFKVKKML